MAHNVIVARLRGVCILVVLILHYGGWYPSIFDFIGHAANNGYYGVTVFFVVSGFLITSHILRRYGEPSRVAVGGFYVMRFARIFPMLALTLALLSVLAFCGVKYFSVGNLTDYLQIMGYVLTVRYNLYIVGPPAWTVLWSLSIEEAFYLIFPLLLIDANEEVTCCCTWRRSCLRPDLQGGKSIGVDLALCLLWVLRCHRAGRAHGVGSGHVRREDFASRCVASSLDGMRTVGGFVFRNDCYHKLRCWADVRCYGRGVSPSCISNYGVEGNSAGLS